MKRDNKCAGFNLFYLRKQQTSWNWNDVQTYTCMRIPSTTTTKTTTTTLMMIWQTRFASKLKCATGLIIIIIWWWWAGIRIHIWNQANGIIFSKPIIYFFCIKFHYIAYSILVWLVHYRMPIIIILVRNKSVYIVWYRKWTHIMADEKKQS